MPGTKPHSGPASVDIPDGCTSDAQAADDAETASTEVEAVSSLSQHSVRLLGRYLNFGTEAKRLRDLCKKAAEDKVTRTTVESVSSRSTKLNAEQCEEILRRYQAGGRPVDIARDFAVTEWTIQNVRKRAGVATRGRGMTLEAITQAVQLYNEGLPMRKIGREVGYSANTVKSELEKRGAKQA